MNNYYQNNEMEIDLIGLCVYILKQWRKLLIFFLVGAIIGCGVSYFKMNTKASENIGTYLAGLKDEDINEDNIRLYADYQALYDAALKRGDTAVILNMDENNVWSAQLNYFITCEYGRIDEVIAYYNSLLEQNDNLSKLLSASGLNCTIADIQDLVYISSRKIGLDNQIITSDSPIEIRNANLSASITAPDENCLKKMLDQVSAIIEDANSKFLGPLDSFTITKLSENTVFGYSSSVAAEKAEYVSTRQELLKKSTDISGKMSDDEKLYYAYNYNQEEYLEIMRGGFSKKWPAIVAVVLAFLAAGYYAVKYCFDKSIKSEYEIERIYGLHVLGSIDNSNYKNVFDKLFDKWGKAGLVAANSPEYLRSVLAASSAQSIAVVCDTDDPEQEVLAKVLAKDASNICIAGNLAADASAVEMVKSCAETIYFAHINCTGKNTFAKYLEASERLNKKSAGVIVIR